MDADRGAAGERESSVLPAAESILDEKKFDEYVEAIYSDFAFSPRLFYRQIVRLLTKCG